MPHLLKARLKPLCLPWDQKTYEQNITDFANYAAAIHKERLDKEKTEQDVKIVEIVNKLKNYAKHGSSFPIPEKLFNKLASADFQKGWFNLIQQYEHLSRNTRVNSSAHDIVTGMDEPVADDKKITVPKTFVIHSPINKSERLVIAEPQKFRRKPVERPESEIETLRREEISTTTNKAANRFWNSYKGKHATASLSAARQLMRGSTRRSRKTADLRIVSKPVKRRQKARRTRIRASSLQYSKRCIQESLARRSASVRSRQPVSDELSLRIEIEKNLIFQQTSNQQNKRRELPNRQSNSPSKAKRDNEEITFHRPFRTEKSIKYPPRPVYRRKADTGNESIEIKTIKLGINQHKKTIRTQRIVTSDTGTNIPHPQLNKGINRTSQTSQRPFQARAMCSCQLAKV